MVAVGTAEESEFVAVDRDVCKAICETDECWNKVKISSHFS